MIPSDIRLFTWLDVEEVFMRIPAAEWPSWLRGVEVYWHEVKVMIKPGAMEASQEWLAAAFAPRIEKAPPNLFEVFKISLETSDPTIPRLLPVAIEERAEESAGPRPKPSFERPTQVSPGIFQTLSPQPFPSNTPPLIAFHSFKGGVGRTLHALALAFQIARNKKDRVLLVDADLEAPGITWLLPSRLPQPPVSFSDFLALAHGDPDPRMTAAIDLVAARLQDASLEGVYVLPAFRSPSRFVSAEIRPEHLLAGSKDPFVLSNLLARLGQKLDVECVIVDLCAGLSELGAGLLLDPRVSRVLVTTLGGQAFDGTGMVLDLIAQKAPSARSDDPIPAVIVNQVPIELHATPWYEERERRILERAAPLFCDTAAEDYRDLLVGPTLFESSLLTIPSDWDEARKRIENSGVATTAKALAEQLPRRYAADGIPPLKDLDQLRRRLAEHAKSLVFAEHAATGDFMPIPPLQKLVSNNRARLPVAAIVGPKGSGKTHTFLQLVARRDWRNFSKAIDPNNLDSLEADILPLTNPLSLSPEHRKLIDDARESVARAIGKGSPISTVDVTDRVNDWLKEPSDVSQWRDRWLDLIAWSAGFEPNSAMAGRKFVSHLQRRTIVVIDGLEDLFQELPSSAAQQVALRSLLQQVPEWLESLGNANLGVLVFVRRDMVVNAIHQNREQFLSRYEPYALRWDRNEALRLVAWVATKASVLAGVSTEQVMQADENDLVSSLTPLWGRKLGGDTSKEGRSAEWIMAALSDFRGLIQARDIVRFLSEAASQSIQVKSLLVDRILVPTGIKTAVSECSKQKVEEVKQENPPLGAVFDKLRALLHEQRQVPFLRETVDLSPSELELLQLNGVVVLEGEEFYVSEIYRSGLSFTLQKAKRAKVLAFARRTRVA